MFLASNSPIVHTLARIHTFAHSVDHNWKSTSPRVLKPDLPPAPALSKESFEKMKHSFNFSLVGLVRMGVVVIGCMMAYDWWISLPKVSSFSVG